MRPVWVTLVALPALVLPAVPTAAEELTLTVEHAGRQRTASVHVPDAGAPPRAVVLSFHGGGGNARNQRKYTRMNDGANRHGYVVVYPNGTGRQHDKLLTWNAGACCGYAVDRGVDDVGFIGALLDELGRRVPIDRTRVYATGLSNGAMMAYRLAADAGDRVAAIAPVAGAMVVVRFAPTRAVAVMHFHSVDDPRAPYAGGPDGAFPLAATRVVHPPVEESLARWVAHNGCVARRHVDAPIAGRGADVDHTATRLRWTGCRDGVEVAHWKLAGAGHVWPGARRNYLKLLLGPGTSIVDANEEMWRFFERFRLPSPGAAPVQ